jgi:hypothetical protein
MNYAILWYHGMEGWSISDERFSDAPEALTVAASASLAPFKIIYIVNFKEATNAD